MARCGARMIALPDRVKDFLPLAMRIAGGLLLLVGLILAAVTEKGLIDHHDAIMRHGSEVLDLGGDAQPEANQHGALARISGVPQLSQPPHDPDFNLQVAAPVLIRRVEMFQWREVDVGGQVHYELDWVDHPLDASRFKHPDGHSNPGAFPIEGHRFDAGQVRVGGFILSPELLQALPGSQPVLPDMRHLPVNLAASFSLSADTLLTSVSPNSPRLGDLRVSWEAVPLQMVTVFARINGDRLVPTNDAANDKVYSIEVGDRAMSDVLSDVPPPPRSAQTRRIVAVLLVVLGVLLLKRPRRGSRKDLPLVLALGVLPVAIMAGTMWLGHGGVQAAVWLGLAALAASAAIWCWRMRDPANPTRA